MFHHTKLRRQRGAEVQSGVFIEGWAPETWKKDSGEKTRHLLRREVPSLTQELGGQVERWGPAELRSAHPRDAAAQPHLALPGSHGTRSVSLRHRKAAESGPQRVFSTPDSASR
eukprot:3869125-Rhodomonas_salina.1